MQSKMHVSATVCIFITSNCGQPPCVHPCLVEVSRDRNGPFEGLSLLNPDNHCPKNLVHLNLLLPYQTVQLKKASVTTEGQTLLWYACKFIVAGLGLRLNGIEVRVRPLPRRKMPSVLRLACAQETQ